MVISALGIDKTLNMHFPGHNMVQVYSLQATDKMKVVTKGQKQCTLNRGLEICC